MFRELVTRGGAVIKEWNSYEGLDSGSQRMIAAVAANTLMTLCGTTMKEWSRQETEDHANALTIALNSVFQIGRTSKIEQKATR